MENDTSPALPTEYTVLITQHRPNAKTAVMEPWPVATITIDQAGGVKFTGKAGKAFGPMEQAFQATIEEFARRGTSHFVEQIVSKLDRNL